MRSHSKKYVTKSLIIFVKENQLTHARLGFAITKKVGKANIRNVYKRIVREEFRCSSNLRNKNIDILVVGKRASGKEKPVLTTLKDNLRSSFTSFKLKTETSNG